MFTSVIALLLFIGGGYVVYASNKGKKDEDIRGFGYFLGFLSIVFVAIAVISTLWSYSNQKEDFQELKRLCATEKIYADKADTLTTKFASYLAEAYPSQEKEIFSKISPEKVGIYFVKYPEIRSNELFAKLVDEINKLQTDRYDQRITRESTLKEMRFRPENPWRFYWFIPTVEELQKKSGLTNCPQNN